MIAFIALALYLFVCVCVSSYFATFLLCIIVFNEIIISATASTDNDNDSDDVDAESFISLQRGPIICRLKTTLFYDVLS